MNGFDLYKEIIKLDSSIKVTFITAFEVKIEPMNVQFLQMMNIIQHGSMVVRMLDIFQTNVSTSKTIQMI
jgi:hypothetical protein